LICRVPDDLRPLHRLALDDADALVGRVGPDDLARPTPCAGWDVAALLAHMIGQHHGFAAAVRDGTAPFTAYAPRPFTPAAWTGSVRTLRDAFAAADLGGTAVLVEIARDALPLHRVVGAQLLDTAVHAWDLARGLGLQYVPAADLAAAVAAVAVAVPDDERRHRPGAAFAPSLPAGDTDWERALARLGRDPEQVGTRGGHRRGSPESG
jgi:uncharacterized protein (TIGR03086 family)